MGTTADTNQTANKQQTDEDNSEQNQWQRTRQAIQERWPDIDQQELKRCANDYCQMMDFVKQRVDASEDEIESIVTQFAPQSTWTQRISEAAKDTLHQASESAQFTYMRADDYLARRPTASVLTAFLTGAVLGSVIAMITMRPERKPSLWNRVRDRTWL